jgi:hypothetical protein
MAEPNNLVERVPITSEDYRVVIMENTRDSAVSFYARSWMPLTVASIEWVGQFYNRPQRV